MKETNVKKLTKTMKLEKGITLITLVIAIALLILIVSIVLGSNDLVKRIEIAQKETDDAKNMEKIKIAILSAKIAGHGNLNDYNLNNELIGIFGDNETAKLIDDKWYYKGYIIDKKGTVEKSDKLLPMEYQQVEYLESNDNQFFDTGLNFKDKHQVAIKFKYTRYNSDGENWLTSDWKSSRGLLVGIYHGDFIFYAGNETNAGIQYRTKADTLEHEVIINKSGVYVDDNRVTFTNFDDLPYLDRNIRLFASNHWERDFTEFTRRIYYCKYWDLNDNLVRHFIPCYRIEDNEIGMYDIVENKFYTNQGIGAFQKGADIN